MTSARRPIVVLGAGGHAREVASAIRHAVHSELWELVAFAVTDAHSAVRVGEVPVMQLGDIVPRFGACGFAAGVGDPRARHHVADIAIALGMEPVSVIDRRAVVDSSASVAAGAVVFAGAIVSCEATVEAHAHVNYLASVSHDSSVGEFSLVSPGVAIAGNVRVGTGAFLGIGASVKNGIPQRPLTIGDWAVVGAGATVVCDIPAGETWVGTPARRLATRQGGGRA